MIISVASGKGGTGKTTIATGLAVALVQKGQRVTYLDADVEEPNGHIFLKPEIAHTSDVTVPIPEVDHTKCNLCGECSEICQFNAIAVIGDKVMVFPSLCISCGGCYEVCPEHAITEVPQTIGQIRNGVGVGVMFYEGRLTVGEAISPPVIKALRKAESDMDVTIIDAPPGTSCPVIEAINNTDYVILVTEPTPFGLHDLKLAVEMVREIKVPHGVVINRADIGNSEVEAYCRQEGLDILLRIPFDRNIAKAYSRGELLTSVDRQYIAMMDELYQHIAKQVNYVGTGNR